MACSRLGLRLSRIMSITQPVILAALPTTSMLLGLRLSRIMSVTQPVTLATSIVSTVLTSALPIDSIISGPVISGLSAGV